MKGMWMSGIGPRHTSGRGRLMFILSLTRFIFKLAERELNYPELKQIYTCLFIPHALT
jgi:hypothetical protein